MLNNRQLSLYNYLLNKKDYVSKKQICKDLPMEYPRHLENNNNEGNKSYAYFLISNDVRVLNDSDIESIIISNKRGFKVADKKEAIKYLERRFKRDFKSLKLNWKLKRKIDLDHQLKFDDDEIKIIEMFKED